MTKECKACGGECKDLGGGKFRCVFCGAEFEEAPAPAPAPKYTEPARQNARESDTHRQLSGADLYEINEGGILEISTPYGSGSGYLITPEGYGITNSHVVSTESGDSCGSCTVKIAGEAVSARVVEMGTHDRARFSTNADLALIKLSRIPVGVKVLKFGRYEKVRTGEPVYVIGNSLGCGTCITSGIVSDKDRNGQLMYDCATNPGNSGGPVFNAEGLVIGTHVAGRRNYDGSKAQGMNIAIPVSEVQHFLRRCGVIV